MDRQTLMFISCRDIYCNQCINLSDALSLKHFLFRFKIPLFNYMKEFLATADSFSEFSFLIL